MTSTIQAALEQGEGRPGRNKSLKAGASAEPGSRAVPKTTCIDGVGHFSGLGAKHGLGALRPALGQYFASMRRIEELIQYRAQFKIVRLTTPAETHRADREAHLEQSQQEQERDPGEG